MDRREFLKALGAGSLVALSPDLAVAAPAGGAGYGRLLILVELKGGNDALNTVVPYADREYYRLRPKLAIARDEVLQLDAATGLHPKLAPLMALWKEGSLAVVQGVGYPQPNLSHFRSIEIWDTASDAGEYLHDGWLTRCFASRPLPRSAAADGVVVGGAELGPFAGGARAVALANTDQFLRQARLAAPAPTVGSAALSHILKVEGDIVQAAAGLHGGHAFRTAFPNGAFGNAVRTACQVAASNAGVAVIKVSLGSFDTHGNQAGVHARLLGELAEGLAALESALVELGRWDSTLVMTYAEFGRRPKENQSAGTDHGTAAAQFVAGGRVRGGLYGAPPRLDRLDGNGNLSFAVDFRQLYATAMERWWGVDAKPVLGRAFAPLDLVRA
jgi:uncharacterized protein (DUF1501 family)